MNTQKYGGLCQRSVRDVPKKDPERKHWSLELGLTVKKVDIV